MTYPGARDHPRIFEAGQVNLARPGPEYLEPEGEAQGSQCNRAWPPCEGVMVLHPVEDCRCHISPPCNRCIDNVPRCSTCEAEASRP